MATLNLDWVREQFPGLAHRQDDRTVAFFDGPAGSQVPRCVADAVHRYLLETNSQHGGVFEVSRASDAILERGHQALADLVGASDPSCIAFGANMTTITFAVSRALPVPGRAATRSSSRGWITKATSARGCPRHATRELWCGRST